MEEFHILAETPANSGTYTETGEIVGTNETDAKLRCIELSQDGTRYGFWVYESIVAKHVLPSGGIGASETPPTSTAAILTGGTIVDPVALTAALDAITDGGFSITIDGVATEVGPLDFTGVAGIPEAASLIDAALGADARCTAGAGFIVATAATGPAATIGYAGAPASGTDISATCLLTQASGATITGSTRRSPTQTPATRAAASPRRAT
jgi:hypothetical protein